MPFRTAYQLVGTLVARAQALRQPLGAVSAEEARAIDQRLEPALAESRDVRASVRSRESAGGTGPRSVARQTEALRAAAVEGRKLAATAPRLEHLFQQLREATW